MAVTAVKTGTASADLRFPAGDTVVLHMTATTPGIDWTGKTWTGQIRTNPSDASAITTLAFVDLCTNGAIDLTATLSATNSALLLAAASPYYMSIRYTSGTTKGTLCECQLITRELVTR